MSVLASELIARITVQGASSAISQLSGVGSAAEKAGKLLGAGLVVGAVAVTAALAYSVKEAADFQQGLNRLKTGAGDTTDNLQKLGQGILQTSLATGVLANGTNGLNAAMYQIVSSGQRGAQALDTLTVAAKGSIIEQANVVDVAKTLSGTMTDYGTSTYSATQYMNGLITAVAHGKITLEELSTTMGPIEPLAANLGIHFADLAGAMSTMTNAQIPAARAATSLRFLFQSLEQPTKKASAAMKEWGVNSTALADELKVSLPGALQMVYDAAKKAGPEGSKPFNNAVSDMIGGMRSLQAFMALTGNHFKDFVTNSQAVSDAMKKGAKDVQGWDVAQSNFNVQLERAHAAINVMAINLGTKLLPVLTPIVAKFADWIATIGHTDFSGLTSAINSKDWQDAATAIGQAATSLGTFAQNLQKVDSQGNVAAKLKEAWNGVGDGVKQVADGFSLVGDLGTFLTDKMTNQAINTRAAFLLMGKDANTAMLSTKDASWLLESGIKSVTDATTGADINLQKYLKTSDLSGSSTVTLAHALELVGKKAGDVLNTADAAKLLGMNIGNVKDMSTGVTTDLKNMVNGTGAFMSAQAKEVAAYYQSLMAGSTQTFEQFDKQYQAHIQSELRATAASADQTRAKLRQLNEPINPTIHKKSIVAAGSTADQTRQKLLNLNGPYHPNVDASSVAAAGNTAYQTWRRLQALNGTSRWQAYVNTYQNTYIATIGQPGSGPGNIRAAGGPITEPVVGVGLRTGQKWTFGENGPEMVIPMGGSHGGGSSSSGSSGSGQPTQVNLQIDGRTFARLILPHVVGNIRNATGVIGV